MQLIELYGEDARLFLLQCLVEETGFKEQRTHTHHGNKDVQKVRYQADQKPFIQSCRECNVRMYDACPFLSFCVDSGGDVTDGLADTM